MSAILVVYGTRPEAIKLGPVVAELRALGADVRVLCTGQHTNLLAGSPAETDLADGISLGMPSHGNVLGWLARGHARIRDTILAILPKVVVVQGDTMSAHAGATAADALGLPVAHVEAGVRSHDMGNPWPEEALRVEITKLARLHLAPTETARKNLQSEDAQGDVVVTGNSVVSALARYASIESAASAGHIVVTLHRRDIQQASVLQGLVNGVRAAALEAPQARIVWPLHPAVERVYDIRTAVFNISNIDCVPPMAYTSFVELVRTARAVLTDSGGLVEEAATLGVPTVIARAANDRPEAVDVGVAVTVDPVAWGVVAGLRWAREAPRRPTAVYGTPDAAKRIAKALVEHYV